MLCTCSPATTRQRLAVEVEASVMGGILLVEPCIVSPENHSEGHCNPGDSSASDLTLQQGNSDNHFIKITVFTIMYAQGRKFARVRNITNEKGNLNTPSWLPEPPSYVSFHTFLARLWLLSGGSSLFLCSAEHGPLALAVLIFLPDVDDMFSLTNPWTDISFGSPWMDISLGSNFLLAQLSGDKHLSSWVFAGISFIISEDKLREIEFLNQKEYAFNTKTRAD